MEIRSASAAVDGPLAHDLPERFNLRDLGGLRTRDGASVAWRRLYRGASLHHLDPEQLERVRELGLRTVVDLRTPFELRDERFPPLPALGARSLPMFERLPPLPPDEDPSALMADLYMTMLEVGRPTILAMLELLADAESYPLAYYCAAGKDRTGVMSALVLGLLGVAAEDVVRDYTLSDAPVDSLRRWIAEHDPDSHDPVPAGVYRAPEQAMRDFLRRLDESYGSVPAYLREIGMPGAVGEAVTRNLLVGGE